MDQARVQNSTVTPRVAIIVALSCVWMILCTGQLRAQPPDKHPIVTERLFNSSVSIDRDDNPTINEAIRERISLCVSARDEAPRCKGRLREFSRTTVATIVVSDVNPFLYTVRVRAVDKPVLEPAAKTFIELAFGAKLPDALGIPMAYSAPQTSSGGAGEKSGQDISKNGDDPKLRYIMNQATLYRKRLRELGEVIDTRDTAISRIQRSTATRIAILQVDTTSVHHAIATAKSVSLDFEQFLKGQPERWRERTDVGLKLLLLDLSNLREYLKELATSRANDPTIEDLFSHIDQLRLAARSMQPRLEALTAGHAAIQSTKATIDSILNNASRFFVFENIGPFGRSTEVTLHIERRRIGTNDAWTEIATEKLTFGGGRVFALGFGAAWSGLIKQTYAAQPSYQTPTTPGGADSVVSRIAVSEQQRGRISPMIMLDVPLPYIPKSLSSLPLRLVGGVSYRGGDAGSALSLDRIEYMPGIGLNLFEGKIQIGAATMIGRQQRLRSDLKIGDRVPSTLTTIPTNVSTRFTLTGFVSLRFQ